MSFADEVRLWSLEDQKNFVLNHMSNAEGNKNLARYFGRVSRSPLEWDRLLRNLAEIFTDKG
jgi:hypothetical protein